MKELLILLIIASFSSEQTFLKRSHRSKHGEDCVSDLACEERLTCYLFRCMTKYEKKNAKSLGLYDTNICSSKKLCPSTKKCVKHRCVDPSLPAPPQKIGSVNDTHVHLLFGGSIYLTHKPYLSGLKSDNTFNYDHLFTHISKYIKNADLSIVEQATPFYIDPEEKKFKKNAKNTPKELGDAIAKAGFNVVLHGSYLAYSHKEAGVINTLRFWKGKHPNVHVLGMSSSLEESEKDYFIYTHEGIKIGIINFSSALDNSIPTKNKFMVNTLHFKKVGSIIENLKQQTDFVIVCMDWGKKSSTTPIKSQLQIARVLTNFGVDIIVGYRSTSIHPITYLKSRNGNCSLIFWSLGTFIGDTENKFNNLGALANIVVSKGKGKAYISSYNLIPIVNHKAKSNEYSVYKLSDYSEFLGQEVNKKFSLKKLKEQCKKLTGAFAYCD
jgi:poly-gamma-glutamate synthesis protein (capsule biosynthesis protein)